MKIISIIGVCLLLLLFAGTMVYIYVLPDGEIRVLDKMESEGKSDALIKVFYERTEPAFSKKILPWLKARESLGYAPYYYATARHLLIVEKPYEALLYYTAAGLFARIDAMACSDSGAQAFILELEKPFGGVRDYVKAVPGTKLAAGTWALNREEESFPRKLPEWICSKSKRIIGQYRSLEEWKKDREEIRKQFKSYISLESE